MMKLNSMKKLLSLIGCIVLIAAMALNFTGCSGNEAASEDQDPSIPSDLIVMGEGESYFYFCAVDKEGVETWFEISTDKETVGEALLELELIDGEQGDYGLYVWTVNGIELDWEKDGKYWAFYADGEYGLTGVDETEINPGSTYMFKPES